MNKQKSLSESSSSDCEDEHAKMIEEKLSSKLEHYYSPLEAVKPHSSTSESEEDQEKRKPHFAMQSFTMKRKFSSDDTEDDEKDEGGEPPAKHFEGTFRNSMYSEMALSGSSADERSPGRKQKPVSVTAGSNKTSMVNSVALKMMAKMGYVEGGGLGRHGQGRTEIVEASKQRGRRGLGLRLEGLEPSNVEWDFEKEEVSVKEEVSWIPECVEEPPLISELREWTKEDTVDKNHLTIENETHFCDPDVLRNVLNCKSVFDQLEPEEMRKARTRSNPFETIRGVIFQNRAAMKMANMDACFDFMFTNPKDEFGAPLVGPNELLYFADVCAGPGGFSEYVLWRKKWECKGFGFTLKGPNDFRMDEFYAGSPETFEPYYGVNGINGDGDVYVPENLREFHRFVLSSTDNKGVHFIMADGGFSVEGQENVQEVLSKRLYLCQFLCALLILRTNGHFVCKLFDTFTPFSVGLVYLMYRAFKHVSIHKPNTSRPANSERYIICKWRRESTKDICDYLFEVNCRLGRLSSVTSSVDIVEVVPLDLLKSDRNFFEYMENSNNSLGEKQVIHLAKIKAFTQNAELYDSRQSEFRKQCLAEWKIPDQPRSAPSRLEPVSRIQNLMKGSKLDFISSAPEKLTVENLRALQNIYDFQCVVCGEARNEQPQGFFLGLGRTNVFRLDPKSNKWLKIEETLELPVDTLVYGELIPELKGEAKAQRRITALHIIDALYIGGRDIRNMHYEQRMNLVQKLAKAVSKPSRNDYIPVRAKEVWQLDDVDQILSRLSMRTVKGSGKLLRVCYEMESGRHFVPSGLLFMKTIMDPWVTAFSKSHQRLYYFNVKNQKSVFDRVPESVANVKSCFSKRFFWRWDKDVQLIGEQNGSKSPSVVHGDMFNDFVQQRLRVYSGVS